LFTLTRILSTKNEYISPSSSPLPAAAAAASIPNSHPPKSFHSPKSRPTNAHSNSPNPPQPQSHSRSPTTTTTTTACSHALHPAPAISTIACQEVAAVPVKVKVNPLFLSLVLPLLLRRAGVVVGMQVVVVGWHWA
jgi:hypothetical protein